MNEIGNKDILYSEHPAMFKNNPLGFIIAVLLIAAFGVGLVVLGIWYIQTRAEKLTITENEILYEVGIMSKESCELNISQIRTTNIKQTFLQRIFGVGTIEIYTTGDTPEFRASGMADPHVVREIIKEHRK